MLHTTSQRGEIPLDATAIDPARHDLKSIHMMALAEVYLRSQLEMVARDTIVQWLSS